MLGLREKIGFRKIGSKRKFQSKKILTSSYKFFWGWWWLWVVVGVFSPSPTSSLRTSLSVGFSVGVNGLHFGLFGESLIFFCGDKSFWLAPCLTDATPSATPPVRKSKTIKIPIEYFFPPWLRTQDTHWSLLEYSNRFSSDPSVSKLLI